MFKEYIKQNINLPIKDYLYIERNKIGIIGNKGSVLSYEYNNVKHDLKYHLEKFELDELIYSVKPFPFPAESNLITLGENDTINKEKVTGTEMEVIMSLSYKVPLDVDVLMIDLTKCYQFNYKTYSATFNAIKMLDEFFIHPKRCRIYKSSNSFYFLF